MHSDSHFFVNYNNQETIAHLWVDLFQINTEEDELLWNLEIYPNGKNLQILKIKENADSGYVEVFRDPKLNADLKTITDIIQTLKNRER